MTVPGTKVGRRRLDEEVVARGLAPSRSNARALIMAGDVAVNGTASLRAGHSVASADEIALVNKPRFVSRGGDKIDHALESFGVDVRDMIAADLGASTGGFTDCLLQRGVSRVYAVDVGYGQLDERLRRDTRVVVLERTNARYLESLPEPIDIVTIDVSFISLDLIFPVAAKVLRTGGICVPLIKPQFEAGRKEVGKGGVVRDSVVHRRVLENAIDSAARHGLETFGLVASPLVGPAGNIEFLAHLILGDGNPGRSVVDAWISDALDAKTIGEPAVEPS